MAAIVFREFQNGHQRLRRLQARCHLCYDRRGYLAEPSRDRGDRKISATTRRSHDTVHVLAHAVRSRQGLHRDARKRRPVLQRNIVYKHGGHIARRILIC